MKMTKAQIAEEMKKRAKRIRDRNYRFKLMTPARKRVAIAKDTIEWIEEGLLVPAQNGYLTVKTCDGNDEHALNPRTEWGLTNETWSHSFVRKDKSEEEEGLREFFLEEAESCTVCGIGGVFVAAVIRANAATIGDMETEGNDAFMRDYLSEWFSMNQLGLIEAAFECDSGHAWSHGADNRRDLGIAAMKFGSEFEDPTDRLLAIMKNIIANNGKFVVKIEKFEE